MSKPTVTSQYHIQSIVDEETTIHIVSKKRSYKTIKLPKGTEINIYISKQPIEVKE